MLVYNYLQATKQVVKPQAPEEQVWTVKSVTAQQADARPLEQAFGTVVAAREAHLRFGVAGEVAQVSDKLRNGADVSTGDVLARLDTERLQLALIQLMFRLRQKPTRSKNSPPSWLCASGWLNGPIFV